MTRVRCYASYLRLRLSAGLQYRAAAAAGVCTQFFWGFLMIMVYEAFYSSSSVVQPMSFGQVVCYVWLQQAFLAFFAMWYRDGELFDAITSGNVVYELVRPLNIYVFWYVKLVAQRLSSAVLRCLPILLVASLLPPPYGMQPPASPQSFALFVLSLALGVLLICTISMLVYIVTFITLNPTGSLLLFVSLGDFLAGLIIPLPLLPEWLRDILYLLPFRYFADFPIRVYSGSVPPSEALAGLGMQLAWLAVLASFGMYAMKRTLRRLVVQGG